MRRDDPAENAPSTGAGPSDQGERAESAGGRWLEFSWTRPKALGSTRSSSSAVFSFNVMRELWGGGWWKPGTRHLWTFLWATVVGAAAHGAMATSAGLLGQALVGRQFVARGALVDSPLLLFSPLLLCFVGFVAALVKAFAGAFSIYAQKRAAFRVGNAVRRDIA